MLKRIKFRLRVGTGHISTDKAIFMSEELACNIKSRGIVETDPQFILQRLRSWASDTKTNKRT